MKNPLANIDSTIPWSKHQLDFFTQCATTKTSIALNAVAGSGKTTTLVAAATLFNKTLALAFNKKTALALAERLPPGAEARTFNSLGHRAWAQHLRAQFISIPIFLANTKTNAVARSLYQLNWFEDLSRDERLNINKIVALAKTYGWVPPSVEGAFSLLDFSNFLEKLDYHGIPHTTADTDIAAAILKESIHWAFGNAPAKSHSGKSYPFLDFNDQLYLPTIFKLKLAQYPTILVDEAQDLSHIQHEMISKSLAPEGRLIAVGDPYQAVYGFRGALADSFQSLKRRFKMTELPLSVSFRCAQNVVLEAQKIVPHIEQSASAPKGDVIHWADTEWNFSINSMPRGSVILCRFNAPLVTQAYEALKAGRGINFPGRDIAAGLVGLIKKLPSVSQAAIDIWKRSELSKASNNPTIQATVEDKAAILTVILSQTNASTKPELAREIERLFSRDDPDITFSSIHRAKGLEWPDVFILNSDLIPSKYAESEWEHAQEDNLLYVAITRAITNLHYIN